MQGKVEKGPGPVLFVVLLIEGFCHLRYSKLMRTKNLILLLLFLGAIWFYKHNKIPDLTMPVSKAPSTQSGTASPPAVRNNNNIERFGFERTATPTGTPAAIPFDNQKTLEYSTTSP